MVSGNTKRIVVIRDIHSNLIEEAILILKTDPEAKSTQGSVKKQGKAKKPHNDVLVKEAEMIITNYIKECKAKGIGLLDPAPKRGRFRWKFSASTLINLAIGGSVVLLVFLLTRFV